MDRPRRESRQHNGITLRGLSQLTFATKSAMSGSTGTLFDNLVSTRVSAITEGPRYAEANANYRRFAQRFRPRQQVFACEQSFGIHRRTRSLDGQRTAAPNGSFAAVFVYHYGRALQYRVREAQRADCVLDWLRYRSNRQMTLAIVE